MNMPRTKPAPCCNAMRVPSKLPATLAMAIGRAKCHHTWPFIVNKIKAAMLLERFNSLAATEAFKIERAKVANAGASLNLIGMLPRYITEIALVIGLGLLVAQRSLSGASSPSPAVLAIFIAGAFRIVASMLPLQASFNSLKQIGEVSKTAISLSRETSIEPEAQPKAKLPEIESSPPSVELQAVSYSFNRGKPILKNISLTIRGGEFDAILGKSGAGKSTLADLILGLRTPHEGRIRIGDQPAREYIDCHPGAVGYVPQKIDLISGTLAQNVTLDSSTTEYDQLAMARAIDLAQLSGVVDQLGEGLGTRIEQGLQIFSGGQLQRIALRNFAARWESVMDVQCG